MEEILENKARQMRKGVLELCILSIIKNEGTVYPSDILTKLKEAKLIVVEGTLYPLLTRLKNEGFLSYEWRESTSGPPRKYYQLTQEGERLFERLGTAWDDLKNAVHLARTSVAFPQSEANS